MEHVKAQRITFVRAPHLVNPVPLAATAEIQQLIAARAGTLFRSPPLFDLY